MRTVCQQAILIKYHALFVIMKKRKVWNCRLLQIIGGALMVKALPPSVSWIYFADFLHAG